MLIRGLTSAKSYKDKIKAAEMYKILTSIPLKVITSIP